MEITNQILLRNQEILTSIQENFLLINQEILTSIQENFLLINDNLDKISATLFIILIIIILFFINKFTRKGSGYFGSRFN